MLNPFETIIFLVLLVILSVLISIFLKIRNDEKIGDSDKNSESELFKRIFDQINESKKIAKLEEQLSQLQSKASDWKADEGLLKQDIDNKRGEIGLLQEDILAEQKKLSERLSNTSGSLNYGEIALERTLELSGLSQGIDYFLQERMKDDSGESVTDADGNDLIPDATIKFPDSRVLYIDAKYPDAALKKLKQDKDNKSYTKKFKTLITKLSNDDYPNRGINTPGFCVLFVPGDHYILEAIKDDENILDFALKRDIVLATPGTLFSIIKTVELSFRRDQLNKNANEFYREARKLIDTTERFITSFNDMELKIRQLQEAYNLTRKRLENNDETDEGLLTQLRRIDDEIVNEDLTQTRDTKVKK
jgi:DNA recombination protein RmuC